MALTTTRRADLEEVVALARPVVEDVVWSTLASVGPDGRPRTRIVHPVLRWDGGPSGWITSRPSDLRRRHLRTSASVSLLWWSPAQDVVTVDGDADWLPDDERDAAWAAIAATPPPTGFDPATIWPEGPSSASFAVIALRARRIRVSLAADAGRGLPAAMWSAPA